jgi:hypothetical protein
MALIDPDRVEGAPVSHRNQSEEKHPPTDAISKAPSSKDGSSTNVLAQADGANAS